MAEIEENQQVWKNWNWSEQGEEWSRWWGGSRAMWFGALLPRVHAFVPTGTILEIAPGYGRWTQYLLPICDRLVAVDLSENCVDACRERFVGSPHAEFHQNDGRSLDMITDRSVDLVFSFDSLVHAEADTIEGYISQLASKLTMDGVGLIHHSNMANLDLPARLARHAPGRLIGRLMKSGAVPDLSAWRAESMSAEIFAEQCAMHGLSCITQERLSWEHGAYLIDTISLFTRRGSKWDRPTRNVRNPAFGLEARRMARLYAADHEPRLGASSIRPGDE